MAGTKTIVSLAAAGVMTTIIPNSGQAAPEGERMLTKREVAELYQGKSWLWEDGSGFFDGSGRFVAAAGVGKSRSTVRGEWTAHDNGRLCFSGVWVSQLGRKFHRTCFLHRAKDGNIQQKRLPEGQWYVFRHDPPQESDQKLVPGDQTEQKRVQ